MQQLYRAYDFKEKTRWNPATTKDTNLSTNISDLRVKRSRKSVKNCTMPLWSILEVQIVKLPYASNLGLAHGPSEKISEKDYDAKRTLFEEWLNRDTSYTSSALSSSETQRYFKKFVKKWNRAELPERFYKREQPVTAASSAHTSTVPPVVKSKHDALLEAEEKRREEQLAKRAQAKRERQIRETLEEELVPKETGRELMLQKKREKAVYAKPSDISDTLDEADPFGTDAADDYQGRVMKQRAAKEEKEHTRQQELAAKVAAYEAKEKEKMAALMDSIGLASRFASSGSEIMQ